MLGGSSWRIRTVVLREFHGQGKSIAIGADIAGLFGLGPFS